MVGEEKKSNHIVSVCTCVLTYQCILFLQDGVKAAKRSIQMEIQTAVHKIYQQLSVTLERALQANKHHIGNRDYYCTSPKNIQVVKYTSHRH